MPGNGQVLENLTPHLTAHARRSVQAPVGKIQAALGAGRQLFVMGDDDETGRQSLIERQHQLEHCFGSPPVEIAGRLIGQHARRFSDQRAGNRRTLALAAGQLTGRMIKTMAQAHFTQHRGCPLIRFGLGQTADVKRHRHVFQRAEFGQQMMKLIDKTECAIAQASACCFRQRGKILAQQTDSPLAGGIQAAEQVQLCAFART